MIRSTLDTLKRDSALYREDKGGWVKEAGLTVLGHLSRAHVHGYYLKLLKLIDYHLSKPC